MPTLMAAICMACCTGIAAVELSFTLYSTRTNVALAFFTST